MTFILRRATPEDVRSVERLILQWLNFTPKKGRSKSIKSAIRRKEILVADSDLKVVGFIHYVLHNDVIDGAQNSFITALYVTPCYRNCGIGSGLLEGAIADSVDRGIVEVETSVNHERARNFYVRHGFRLSRGDMDEVFLELDLQDV